MKKKILVLMMAVLTAVMMVGCNTTGLALMDEIEKVYDWEAIDSTAQVVVEVEAGEEKLNVYADINAYMSMTDNAVEGVITPKKIVTGGTTIDLTKGEMAIAPIKLIVKDGKTYYSKSYFEDLYKYLLGIECSKSLQNIKSEYIGIDMAAANMSKENIKQSQDLIKAIKTDVEIKQNGRTYDVAVSGDKTIELLKEVIVEVFNTKQVKDSMLATGEVTEEDYVAFQQEIVAQLPDLLEEAKKIISDSSIKVHYEFADNNMKYNGEFNIVINGEEKTNIKVTFTEESKKVAKREIKIPADTKVYSVEEFGNIIVPASAYFFEDEVIKKGNTTYIPLRDTMDQLGIELKYDSKTKTTTVIMNDKEVKLQTYVKDGVSYISKEQIQKLGFDYSVDEDGAIYIEQIYE